MTTFGDTAVSLQEAIGPVDDISFVELAPNGFVHLLGTDEHSNQHDVGYARSELSPDSPYSFERWLRIKFFGTTYSVRTFRFWATVTVPDGWELKFGSASDYAQPTNDASSIATNAVPTSDPGTENCGGATDVSDGTNYSDWIVLQAHVPDFSAVAPGPMLGSTGGEVVNPVLIQYHFTWHQEG